MRILLGFGLIAWIIKDHANTPLGQVPFKIILGVMAVVGMILAITIEEYGPDIVSSFRGRNDDNDP